MQKIFERAVDIAVSFDKNLFPGRNLHLSLVSYKGRFVSIGINRRVTHPANLRYNPKINQKGINFSDKGGTCAEYSAFVQMKRRNNIPFDKCDLINIRINKLDILNNSCPCNSCKNLLKFINFKSVYYSILSNKDNPKFERYL